MDDMYWEILDAVSPLMVTFKGRYNCSHLIDKGRNTEEV